MRFFHVALVIAVFLATIPAYGEKPAGSPHPNIRFSKEQTDSLREMRAQLRFAPMWLPVPKFASGSKAELGLPVPLFGQTNLWQREWQEELGLSAEQKKSLMAILANATAESKKQAEQFQKMSPEERKKQMQAQAQARAKQPLPSEGKLDGEVRRQIEAVLTPQQLKTIKDYSFPAWAVGLLRYAKVREEIGFTTAQEARFRGVVRERLARFQEVSLDQAEKLWGMLTPQQQAAFPEVVKGQGPTSAVLSIAWDIGFDRNGFVPAYPMLAEAPVRTRLGLSAQQEKQIDVIMAESAARQKAREEQTSQSDSNGVWEDDVKKRVEAILTPQQLTFLNQVDFRRKVVLAFHYPEKRKSIGITEQQVADYEQLVKNAHKPMYDIDRAMLGRAVDVLTPAQNRQLRTIIDRMFDSR